MSDHDTTSQQLLLGQQLLEKFTLASKEETIENGSCPICQEAYFTGQHSEMPVKAPCGHIFGSHCIKTWFSSVGEPKSCPMCRRRVLDGRTRRERDAWRDHDFLFAHGMRQPLIHRASTPVTQEWVLEAERLWRNFCEAMVSKLEETTNVYDWVLEARKVREILEFTTVGRFARECADMQSRIHYMDWVDFLIEYPLYDDLCNHLDSVDASEDFFLSDQRHFIWLAEQYMKISRNYDRLLRSVRPRDD